MEVVFIDSEPKDLAGGGIRTYIRMAMRICREAGHSSQVYTHNPGAYPGEKATPIGRKAWLTCPFRGLAYRLLYHENVLWEHAYWLHTELALVNKAETVFEFCDFLGYGFFVLRNKSLRKHSIVRVHTPAFLISASSGGTVARLGAKLACWREIACLRKTRHITVPSGEFVREMLPWLRNWSHIPNPLPIEPKSMVSHTLPSDVIKTSHPERFLYLGRLEERKGVLILIRAFARLARDIPDVTLTLVGGTSDSPYAAAVRYLVASQPKNIQPRIRFEEPCTPDKKSELLQRFTALVVPSLWENSPYVYFEGMAAGLFCIGSATGEMKTVAEITGAISPKPGDEDDLWRALKAHCNEPNSNVIVSQSKYLVERQATISSQLLKFWEYAALGRAEKIP